MKRLVALSLLIVSTSISPDLKADDDTCASEHGFSYLCDVPSAEDLVQIPGTSWLVASGFSGGISLNLIDVGARSLRPFYPSEVSAARHDAQMYPDCPEAPEPDAFVSHGLHVRATGEDTSLLYVVGHGARETIEIFEIDSSADVPGIAWVGCVFTPDGMAANSVTSMSDGSILATIPLHTGIEISDIFLTSGGATGAAYAWSPGDKTLAKIVGTEMSYANGIEVSEDESRFLIASSGHQKIFAFSNENPAKLLGTSGPMDIIPDNLHRDSSGRMITAGLSIVDPFCGDVALDKPFDLEAFASCHRPFSVVSVDPSTLALEEIAGSPAHTHFSNVTMALEVDGELWIGTFAGDRVAYRSIKASP